ncbi:MAG: hypothetical protein KDB27_32770, partial [Planctomycetales bacterium]|nr:hypothetical protein [Planctomycetales bacterium]
TETVFTSNSCAIGNFVCNTSVFVQGWPQRPLVTVLPPANRNSPDDFVHATDVYTLSSGATENVFVHTAALDVGPGSAPPGPGIKQIHMILPGFSNPNVEVPTDYEIVVRQTRTGENGDVQVIREGSGPFTVIPEVEPSINLTSVFDPTRSNTVYQEIMPGETPRPYEFYMWNGEGTGYTGISFDGENVLDDAQRKIGRISITGPAGATGQSLVSVAPSSSLDGGDVFFGLDTARLTAQFTPGNLPGEYVSTIEMFSKSDIGMENPAIVSAERLTVQVVPEPTSMLLGFLPVWLLGMKLRRRRVMK